MQSKTDISLFLSFIFLFLPFDAVRGNQLLSNYNVNFRRCHYKLRHFSRFVKMYNLRLYKLVKIDKKRKSYLKN